MALRTISEKVEQVANGFYELGGPLPEYGADITHVVGDLFYISASLKRVDGLTRKRDYQRYAVVVDPDLDLLYTSLKFTVDEIMDYFAEIDERSGSRRDSFKRTWIKMCKVFLQESGVSLRTRLAQYKAFLSGIEDLVLGKLSQKGAEFMIADRANIKVILANQENRIAARLASLSIGTPSTSTSSSSVDPASPASDRRPRNRKSYERARPSQASPTSPLSASSGAFSDIPPWAPAVPVSPVTSSSQSTKSNTLADHWIKHVFQSTLTRTTLPYSAGRSLCLGEIMPGLKKWLREEGFEEVFQMAFNGDSDLRVMFYVREDDYRARVVCKLPHKSKADDYFCLPLNLLEIVRADSGLHLCRRKHKGTELFIWAILKFTTVEQMVLFFCCFLALRSQDAGKPVHGIRDYEMDGEEELFAAPIIDDFYMHALRIFQEKDTGVIRLQASIHKGEMKRAPVWNAFITHQIGSRGWIRLSDTKTVLLRELDQTLFFFEDYTPPVTRRGEHILKFVHSSDARAFVNIIQELKVSCPV